ncbi:MAG: hypothetical protein QOH64_2465 [Acidimicrobiaceae bacterium]|jgi:hypothetical protein
MGRLVGLLKGQGFRKGVAGSSRPWMAVWVLITATQLARKLTSRKAVVERFTLKPGESLIITDLGVPESEAPPVSP